MRPAILLILTSLLLPFLQGCDILKSREYTLEKWNDGTNEYYAIENPQARESFVVIPDVRAIQKNDRFISGNAYWNYIGGTHSSSGIVPFTNEFWFVLDKSKTFPKCYVFISRTNEQWIHWCMSHDVPTNLMEIKEFVDSISPEGGGHRPPL
jgi:hypothetical protein